ncbi:hypothetical protein [Burkholderia pseudomallei]|uniref:hypothetical protein n=1 Tax=Burkholderia pseudomallei TaxID=28450 RepID=UPI000F51126B|nr:hypothetical protein [Burkholderia pseudomallei]RPE23008.1 hypothetical protein DF127_05665 [Burkholderia pseudomallei]RQS99007.1 hypothetical protein DF125_02815 [Burkholderia pseudomallei]
MQLIITKDLNDLKSCDGKVVGVTVTNDALQISLRSVVSLDDYKALAALGRQAGCSFNERMKTTTIPLISKTLFKPRVIDLVVGRNNIVPTQVMSYKPDPYSRPIDAAASDWDDVAMIVALNLKGTRDLFALVFRLGAPEAKTFATVKDAMAAKPSKRSTGASRASEDDEDYAIREVGAFEDADHDHM